MKETLRFHIPPVGTVETMLHDESARAYRWLSQAGEVERLKHLDHLGAIRLAWDGAHHSRWEYITFIWSVIDRCSQVPEVHVGSVVRLPGGHQVSSGSELLKCWALLLNVGHLKWTFAAERALLFELWRNQEARRDFSRLVSGDPGLQAWAEAILKEGRVYQLFQALALVRLRRLATAGVGELRWEPILAAYILEDSEQSETLQRLRGMYRRIRQAAYLALDTHYTPSLISVDPRQLLSDSRSLARVVLRDEKGDDEWQALEAYLYREVYLAEPVVRSIASREPELRRCIRRSLRTRGMNETIELLARGEIQSEVSAAEAQLGMRLPLWVPEPFDDLLLNRINPRALQERLDRELRKWQGKVRASAWNVPYGRHWVLQLHTEGGDREGSIAAYRLAFETVSRLRKQNQKWLPSLGERELHDLLLESLASALVLTALDLIQAAAPSERLRWEWAPPVFRPVALFAERGAARRFVDRELKNKQMPADVQAEYVARRELLRYRPTALAVVSLGRVVGYKPSSGEQAVEVDGCIVETGESSVRVTLLEVKRQQRAGKSSAKRDLREKLKILVGDSGRSIQTANKRDTAWAWTVVEVP